MSARFLLLAGLALITAAACAPSPDASPESRVAAAAAAVDSGLAAYVAAAERGDTAALASLFAEDVEVVFPTGPLHRGRSNATQAFAEMFTAMSIRSLLRTNTHRIVTEDVVVETGDFSIMLQPTGAADVPAINDVGFYAMVWQRQDDGTWKIARGFNRSNAPTPAPPAR
jgi:uncharacterized protein (TIGR02246 family)